MIQRPQTLLLIVVVALMSITAFSNVWKLETESMSVILNTRKITVNPEGTTYSTIYLAVVTLGSAIVALFSIFQYKNRKLQMIIGAINNLIITSFLLLVTFVALPKAIELSGAQKEGAFSIAYFLPLGALVANFISNKLIKKDENLVRSMDRMR